MKKIIVNGQVFLGSLVVAEDKIIVKNAITDIPNDIGRAEFAKYFKQKNLGRLQTITFAGHGTTYSMTDLTEDQELEAKIVLLNMRKAKSSALLSLENDMLDSLLGKL